MNVDGVPHRTVELRGAEVDLIDQTALPHAFRRVRTRSPGETAEAIRTMVVRGAGAIGATAAAGVAQAALLASDSAFSMTISDAAERIRATRPTARNLFYGVERVLAAIAAESIPRVAREAAVFAARAVIDEDAAACEAIGAHGAALIADGARVATHCNAGWLAFVDWGSALAPIYRAKREGRLATVWVDETRPRLQGAMLTAWELAGEGVPHRVAADHALAVRMRAGEVDLVIVGADRIASNGDVANKIGTYAMAVLARAHGVPFYVAAPHTTLDPETSSGSSILIEERSEDEVAWTTGVDEEGVVRRVRTTRSPCWNPAFDVTPAELVTAYVTPAGVVRAAGLSGMFVRK